MNNQQFTIVLPSNASMDIFPDNRLSHFKVRLPQRIELTNDWECGLSEISFTKSWYNMPSGENITISNYPSDKLPIIEVDAGNYNKAEDLISHINSKIQSKWSDLLFEIPVLTVDAKGLLNYKKPGRIDRNTGIQLKFSSYLTEILGVEQERPINIHQKFTSLFVYCSIIDQVIIGHTRGPLLRVVNAHPEFPFGRHITETFEEPYYMQLSSKTFDEIEIYLRNDSGEAPYFNFGRVVISLHFKRQ
jgi:hypothetical protein